MNEYGFKEALKDNLMTMLEWIIPKVLETVILTAVSTVVFVYLTLWIVRSYIGLF